MLEKVMAVLVAQDHRDVLRRTPSSGDGGVDLLIADGDGWHVRQVKGFTGRVDAGRRRQVQDSFEEVCEDPRLDRPITKWSLTVPIDPTSGEQEWFEGLTASAPFPCNWDGEVFWNSMASCHPHVIDYYLRDGRERVESRARALLDVSSAPSLPLSANDVAGHLETLRTSLNQDNPHYRYEFVTGPAARAPNAAPPGCVMTVTSKVEDYPLMIQVFPKHTHALEDAPIRGTMNITIFDPAAGIDIREQFDSFQMFGTAIALPEGSLAGSFVAPGGLGGEIEGGAGWIGPPPIKTPPRTRVRLVDTESGETVELGLVEQSASTGQLGGSEVKAVDESGLLDVTFRVGPPGSHPPLTFHMTGSSIAGRPIQQVLPVARFLASVRPPMRFEWLTQYGNEVIAAQTMTEDLALLTPGELALLEDLNVIQGHVHETVTIPENLPTEAVEVIVQTAQLIRQREVTGTWERLEVSLKEDAVRGELIGQLEEGKAIALEWNEVLQLDEDQYELGRVRYIYACADAADPQPDDPTVLRFVPGSDDTMKRALGPSP
jgi:hypothetical protein